MPKGVWWGCDLFAFGQLTGMSDVGICFVLGVLRRKETTQMNPIRHNLSGIARRVCAEFQDISNKVREHLRFRVPKTCILPYFFNWMVLVYKHFLPSSFSQYWSCAVRSSPIYCVKYVYGYALEYLQPVRIGQTLRTIQLFLLR